MFSRRKADPPTADSRKTALIDLAPARWGRSSYRHLSDEGYRRNVVAHRCIRMIAECGATVPVKQAVKPGPARTMIDRPNPSMDRASFLEALFAYLQISGNAYVEAISGPDGRPRGLYLLRPDRVHVKLGRDGWPESYEYRTGGQVRRLPAVDAEGRTPLLHLRNFHPNDDLAGLAPIEAAAYSLEIHNAASAWNKALLDNAARPSGALVFDPGDGRPANLTDDQIGRLKAELVDQYQGAANAGRPFLLEGGLKWQQIAMSPADMDFMASKNGAARDIALAFGVPPMMLGIPGDNTYGNYQEANRAFWRLTVLPMTERTLAAIDHWLADWFGEPEGLTVDRDALPALAEDREKLWQRLGQARFLTVNEKRAAVGLPPIKDGDRLDPAL